MTASEEATSAAITILRARGRRLSKIVHPDGTIESYDQARTFDLFERPVGDLDQLAELLRKLEGRGDCCVVRGKPADSNHTSGVRRLLYPDHETGELPTLVEVPRKWVALDFDDLARPDWIEPGDLIACGVVAIRELPLEFRQARFIVQATSSHGLRPGIRVRLWGWLDRPITGRELKYWLRGAPVDPAIFGPAQIIYSSAPVFPGAVDPLQTRLALIPGRDEVNLPPPARLTPPPPIPRPEPSNHPADPILPLVRAVENAPAGNRNALLYWSARRASENPAIDRDLAEQLLRDAAQHAGLSASEAGATIRSAYRG